MRAFFFVSACLAIGACGPTIKDPSETIESIDVEPANATLQYTGAAAVTLDYKAIAHYADGHTAELADAVFTLDDDGAKLGAFSAAQFAVSGLAAGKGGVFATADEIVGGTSVIVEIHPTRLGPGVPPDGADRFPDTSLPGALSPTIVYPLDGAVMPASVKSPDIQWEGAVAGDDLYRVRVRAGMATIDTILLNAPGFKFDAQLSAQDWQILINSVGTGAISVSVDHWDVTNGAHGGAPVQTKIVNADITGAIYYWNLNEGRMERIDAAGRGLAIQNPPPRPGDGKQCVACHSVSKDGRYLSGSLWDAGQQGAVFDMSDPAVRTANPAPTVTPLTASSYTALFSTFNGDASRLLVNVGSGFNLIDPQSGTSVAVNGTPLPTTRASHPAWSPDSTAIAFVNNIRNGADTTTWAVDYTVGDLQVINVSPGDTFGAPVNLVTNTDPAFSAPSWPSFTPDSNWIAYGAGSFSRGKLSPNEYPGSLFVISRAGGVPQRLDIACGGARRCYLPNFGPYDAGGYYWLIHYSFRDYGNALAGTKGTGRRQMWVTAIDKSKLNGSGDPSSVSFWVPDQDPLTENMSAFWALPAPIQ